MTLAGIALLGTAGFGAGLVDAIAGGGGLVTVPALFAAGIPPIFALGTNKVQSSVGTAVATWRYHRAGLIAWRALLPALATTAVGAAAGAELVQSMPVATVKLLVPFLMIGAIVYFLVSPRMTDADSRARLSLAGYAPIAGAIGCYDGFFGPGTGSFLAASLVALAGLGLSRATGHTKALNLTSNVVAAALFLAAGKLLWGVALVMGAANIAGAWVGTHLALRHGAAVIRPLLVMVSLGLVAKVLFDPGNPVWGLARRLVG